MVGRFDPQERVDDPGTHTRSAKRHTNAPIGPSLILCTTDVVWLQDVGVPLKPLMQISDYSGNIPFQYQWLNGSTNCVKKTLTDTFFPPFDWVSGAVHAGASIVMDKLCDVWGTPLFHSDACKRVRIRDHMGLVRAFGCAVSLIIQRSHVLGSRVWVCGMQC